MRRRFPIALSLVAATATALLMNGGLHRYTHPDMAGVPTEDLSREAIRLTVDHLNEPFALQWPHMERQRVISEEIAKRQPELIARIRAEDEAELAQADATRLALAEPAKQN